MVIFHGYTQKNFKKSKQLKSKPPTIEEPVLGEAASFASFRAIFFGKTRTHLSLLHMIHVAPERNSAFFGWGITFPPRSWESKGYPPSPWLPRKPTIFVALWKIQTTLLKEMPDHQGQLFDAGWMGNPYIPGGQICRQISGTLNISHFLEAQILIRDINHDKITSSTNSRAFCWLTRPCRNMETW